MVLTKQELLHDEFETLLKNIYHAVKYENVNFTRVIAIAKDFEGKITKLSEQQVQRSAISPEAED